MSATHPPIDRKFTALDRPSSSIQESDMSATVAHHASHRPSIRAVWPTPLNLADVLKNRDAVGFLAATLMRYGVASSEVEDGVQECCIVLHRRRADYNGRCLLSTWLFGVARRVAARLRRRRATELRNARAGAPEHRAHGPLFAASELVVEYLDQLESNHPDGPMRRAIFVLCEIEGHSNPEAADMLGLPANTAASIRLRVRRAFHVWIASRAQDVGTPQQVLARERRLVELWTSPQRHRKIHRTVLPLLSADLALGGGIPALVETSAGADAPVLAVLTSSWTKLAVLAVSASLCVTLGLMPTDGHRSTAGPQTLTRESPAPASEGKQISVGTIVHQTKKLPSPDPSADPVGPTRQSMRSKVMAPPAEPPSPARPRPRGGPKHSHRQNQTSPPKRAPGKVSSTQSVGVGRPPSEPELRGDSPMSALKLGSLRGETQHLTAIRAAFVRGQYAQAQSLAKAYKRVYPSGHLSEAVHALEIRGQCRLGGDDHSPRRAQAWLASHRRSIYAQQVVADCLK